MVHHQPKNKLQAMGGNPYPVWRLNLLGLPPWAKRVECAFMFWPLLSDRAWDFNLEGFAFWEFYISIVLKRDN